ncbi:MAG TPA: hypothetical protein VMS77_03005 [Conexivisphaerales archaeon]|nr:hypothetical protein [Conexivisphaerales archaeon]
MSGAPFDESGLQGLTDLAKNAVAGIAGFLKAILAQVTQLIVEVSIPLAVVLVLTGAILYFSHLNRRLGRDFVILSILLAIINQVFR